MLPRTPLSPGLSCAPSSAPVLRAESMPSYNTTCDSLEPGCLKLRSLYRSEAGVKWSCESNFENCASPSEFRDSPPPTCRLRKAGKGEESRDKRKIKGKKMSSKKDGKVERKKKLMYHAYRGDENNSTQEAVRKRFK